MEGAKRVVNKLDGSAVIIVQGSQNYRPTSRRHTLFVAIKDGMTVTEFVTSYESPKIAMEYLRWFVKTGAITVA